MSHHRTCGCKQKKDKYPSEQSRKPFLWDVLEEELESASSLDGYPIPTQNISNGEFLPGHPTATHRKLKRKLDELSQVYADKLGITKDEFLRGEGGLALSFFILNKLHDDCYTVDEEEICGLNKFTKKSLDMFIVDGHTHWFEDNFTGPRDLADEPGEPIYPPLCPNGQALALQYFSRKAVKETLDFKDDPTACTVTFGELPEGGVPAICTINPANNDINVKGDLADYIHSMFYESATDFVNITNVPVDNQNFRFVTNEQALYGRNQINSIFQEKRAIVSAVIRPTPGDVSWVADQAEVFINDDFDTWKAQTIGLNDPGFVPGSGVDTVAAPWRLDDFATMGPFYDLIVEKSVELGKPEMKVIHVHKGVGPASLRENLTDKVNWFNNNGLIQKISNPVAGESNLFGLEDGPGSVPVLEPAEIPRWWFNSCEDIPRAAQAYPDVNFVIYHSAYDWVFWFQESQPGVLGTGLLSSYVNSRAVSPNFFDGHVLNYYLGTIDAQHPRGQIPWTTDLATIPKRFGVNNVYCDLAGVFQDIAITEPEFAALFFGIMIEGLGPDNVLWGTDSIIFGSPQYAIEAFLRLNIYKIFHKYFGVYPCDEPEDVVKEKILGLNAKRLYGLDEKTLNLDKLRCMKEKRMKKRKCEYYGYVAKGSAAAARDIDMSAYEVDGTIHCSF